MKKIFTLLFLSLLAASKVVAQCACDFIIDFEPDPNNQCCFDVYYCNNGGPACTPGLDFNELHIYTNSNISFTEPIAGVTASFSGITAVQAGTFEVVFTGDFGAYSQECVSRIHIGQICLGGGSQPSVGVEFSAQMNIPNGVGLCSLTVSNTTFDIYDCEAPLALFEKLYGDSSENRPTAIKAFGDGIYVAGYRVVNGNDYGTFTKFDLSTGALVWEKQLSIPSRILDFEHIPPPWSVTEEFLLVGHTPFVASPIPLDNRSFLLRLDDTGAEVFFKNFDQTGREHFDRIVLPSIPVDYQFPYYIVGRKNAAGQSQTGVDKVVLYNVDANGVHNWGREYTYNSFPAGDDEFHRGVIPRGNGNLLLMGNDVPNNDGIIVEVNGFTGAVVGAGKRYHETLDIYDALVLPDGNTIIVGEYFHPNPADRAAFAVVLDQSLTPVVGRRFPSIASFKDIWTDQNGNLWTIGENKDINAQHPHNYPVVIGLDYTYAQNAPQLYFLGGRYLSDGETEFANGVISVTPNHDRIFYADARRVNPAGFGDWDMLVGAFDLGMTSECSKSYDKSSFDFVFAKTDVPITSVVIPEPPFTTAVSMLPFQYGCSNFCDNCDLSIGFDAFPVNCTDMQFIGYAYGGTAPYTFSWDIPYDGTSDIIGQNPLNIGFSSSGSLPVGMTVVDAVGCSATIAQDVFIPEDLESPILDCPSGNLFSLTDPGVCFSEQNLVNVLDNCDPFPIVICELTGASIGTFTGPAPIQYQKGTTFVSCTAIDVVGNISECAFSMTVLDEEVPTIICPPSQQLTIPFCDQFTTAFYAPPTGADNCPMVAFSATHSSGSEFPCGATTVIYTATDMSGNTSTCNFEINVTCTCASMGTASIECGPAPDTYAFTMVVNNASGSGLPCDLFTTLPVDQGTLVSAPTITWDAANTVATITGIIQAILPIPSQFDLTVLANCTCPSGLTTVCPLSVSLTPACCRSVSLHNLEICRESPSHTVSLDFFGSVTNLVQVDWYMADGPCPANAGDPGWLLYATTFAATTDVFPPYLAGDFCMYAVVTVGDFPCQTLTTNIAHITLCEPVACTLPDQKFCYTGSAITPLPIDILVDATSCPYTIDWLDAAGNPIPALHGQTSFQPPPVLWSGLPGDCKQDFTFSAQVTGPCGPRKCTATISLYDDAAPAGVLDMVPFESQAFCPGEDATLLFVPGCPKPPSEVVWEWFSSTDNATFVPVPGAGMTNTLIHTNRLWQDTWFAVDITNGVCSTDRVEYFIDVLDVLALASFSADYNDICNPTGVTMTVNIAPCNTSGGPCNCEYTIAWYRDWDLLHTDVNTSGPFATYTHIPASIDLIAGNYYAVITENCCGQNVKSDVIEIGPPAELVVAGPCFNCNYETQTVEAILIHPMAGVSCSYNWATVAPGNILSGQSTSQIEVNAGGLYWVTVTCSNGCTKTGNFNLKQCGGAVVASIAGNTVICPGATTLLTASGGSDYLWSTGSIDETIAVQVGTYTVTVTGSNGATATAEVTVILSPGTSIEWHNVPAVEVFVACAADVPPPDMVTASDDLGGDVPVVFDEQIISGDCPNQFVVVRTWTATVVSDVCGTIVSEFVQIIDVNDTQPPVLDQKPEDLYYSCDAFILAPMPIGATDNCGDVTVTFSETYSESFCINSETVRHWVATDACGNTDEWTQHIVVEDLVPPVLFGLPVETTLTLADTDPFPPAPTVTAEDNCSDSPMVAFSETNLPATCTTPRFVLRTWSAEDLCGNIAIFTQEIQIGTAASALASISGATVICPGGSSILTASGGGDYIWSTTEETPDIAVSAAGIYTVTVTNSAGCTGTAQVTVEEAPINLFSVSGGGAICPGDVSCISLSGSDIDVLYTVYRNATPVVQQQGTGASMSICHPFISGTYTIWGTRSGTTPVCSLKMTGNAVFTYLAFPKGGNLTGPNSYCAGGLGVFLSINNTSTGVEYALFLNGNTNPLEVVQGNGGNIQLGLFGAGTYYVVSTNLTTGCSITMPIKTVVENPLPTVFNVTGGGVRCPGDPGLPIGLDGSEPGVSYRLKRTVNGVTSNASAAISGTGMALMFGNFTTAGTYTVMATTSAGCMATMAGSAVITNSTLPIAYSTTGGGSYCAGGAGVSFGLSGSQFGMTYQLFLVGANNSYTPAALPISGLGGIIITAIHPYASGNYVFVATNADGCTRVMGRPRLVTVIPLPVVFNVTGGGAICPGTAGVSIGLDGSQLGVNYRLKRDGNNASLWIPGGGGTLDFGTFNTPGTYTVMATTATAGCMANMNGSVVVAHSALPLVFQITGGGTYCMGGTGVPIGLSNSELGVLYHLYVTNSNGTMQVGGPVPGSGAITFGNQTIPGIYSVIATNAAGCTGTMSGSASVGTNTPPLVSIIGINTICEGGSTTLAVTGGGILPMWSTGAVNTTVITASPTVTTTYSVTVTNASNSCTASASKTVIVHPKPAAFQVTGGGVRCVNAAGLPIGLDNSQTGVQYTLVGPSNTTVAGPVNGSTGNPIAFGLFATGGTYSVVATNTSTLCTATMNGSATVTVVPLPAVYNVTGGGAICAGDAGMPVGLSGSQFLVRYELYRDGQPTGITADGDLFGNPIAFSNQTIPGVYTVVATSIAGGPQCTQLMNGSVNIILISTVVATISGPAVLCGSSAVTLTASGGGTYLWSTGETTASIQVTPVASSSTYAVTVTLNKCSSSTSTVITVIDPPSFAYSGEDQTICAGSSATLDANIPTLGDGIWSMVSGPSTALSQFDNPILPWATFTPTGGAGVYTLRWTISNLPCPATFDDVVITVLAQPVLAGSLANQVVCNGSLTAPANFFGVPAGAVFQWTCDNPAVGLGAGGVGNIPAFTAINTGTTPVVATVTVTPVLPGRFAYITNAIDHTVSVIEIPSHTVVATVPVGDSPFGVCVHPDGSKVYVANLQSNTVSVINTATNTVGATIPVGYGSVGVCISRDGTRVYVTNSADGTISVINTATNSILATIPVGVSPWGIAVSPDGGRVYVANSSSNQVSVINTVTNSVIATIGTGLNPTGVVVSPSGGRVYVTNLGSDNVSVISTATNTVLTNVGVGDGPTGISIAPNGSRVYVSNNTSSTVSVINTATNVVVGTISASNKPYGNSVTPDGSRLYVANHNSGIISATSTATNAGIGAVGLGSSGPRAFGNFIGGTLCTGAPISYTITVNPSPGILIVSSTPSPSNPLNSTVTVAGFGGMPPYTYQRCPSVAPFIPCVNARGGVFANVPPGTWTFTVKDAKGCVGTVTYTVVPLQSPDAEDRSADGHTAETTFDFSVAPNPVAGEITSLLFSGNFAQTGALIRVHDLAGRLMLEQKAAIRSEARHQLPVGELPAGMYRVTVWIENGRACSRPLIVTGE